MALPAAIRNSLRNAVPRTMPATIADSPMITFSASTILLNCFFEAPDIAIKPNCLLLARRKHDSECAIKASENAATSAPDDAEMIPIVLSASALPISGCRARHTNRKKAVTAKTELAK